MTAQEQGPEQGWRSEVARTIPTVAARLFPDRPALPGVALTVAEGIAYVASRPVAPYTVAVWAVRHAARSVPKPPREIVPAVEFPVADAAVYDGPADGQYRISGKDVRDEILERAVRALRARIAPYGAAQVEAAVETLWPIMARYVDGRLSAVASDGVEAVNRQARYVPAAAPFVDAAREAVLAEVGTVPTVKVKPGMRKSPRVPTSGPASVPVRTVDGAPGTATWALWPDRSDRIEPWVAELMPLVTPLPPHRNGTEREEESWDRLQKAMRPARKPGRNSGKQKGRMGGPASIR